MIMVMLIVTVKVKIMSKLETRKQDLIIKQQIY